MTQLNETQMANRVAWIRALVSGAYQQGFRALKRKGFDGNDELSDPEQTVYCCLGVACEVINPESEDLRLSHNIAGFMTSSALMTYTDAWNLFGLSELDQTVAAGWNDRDHYAFSRIADFVAYAASKGTSFHDISVGVVPYGFAAEWLENQK